MNLEHQTKWTDPCRIEKLMGLFLVICVLMIIVIYSSITKYNTYISTNCQLSILSHSNYTIPPEPYGSNDSERLKVTEVLYGMNRGMNLILKNKSRILNDKKKYKMLFIVGTSGTGHHAWNEIMKNMETFSKKSKNHATCQVIGFDRYPKTRNLLVPCLRRCFYHDLWELDSVKVAYFDEDSLKRKLGNGSGCDCVSKLFLNLQNEWLNDISSTCILYFIPFAYSYPFNFNKIHWMPSLSKLIELSQSKQLSHIFDLKLIVMKRNPIHSLVSHCLRFGSCDQVIKITPQSLIIIQSQLLTIDPSFWIMIDYNDLVQRSIQYSSVLSKFLQIDEPIVKYGLKSVRQPTHSHIDDTIEQVLNKLNDTDLIRLAKISLLKKSSQSQWPLFLSDYFVVTPENTAFLDNK